MREYAVIIPAYQPKEKLSEYIHKLLFYGVAKVIVINDGSSIKYKNVFKEIKNIENVTLLCHKENQGKGRALKTGFHYFLNNYSNLPGLVTADADGQHQIKDVIAVGDRLLIRDADFALGMREFKLGAVPVRSWLGNRITSLAFKGLFGTFLQDTQTGLRGIHTRELDWISQLRGEQFDYEMNMLMQMIKRNKRIIRVDIQTIYKEAHVSHYRTCKDSKRIMKEIIRSYLTED